LEEQITIETDTSRFRPADKEVQLADISKLKRTLNWEPEQELKEVLLELLKFEGLIHTHGA
jgi:GDP-D-mannose dehydratase